MVNDFKEIKTLDIFCGAGGFSKGFEIAGYNILAGIDYNEKLKQTFEHNHKNSTFIHHDLLEGVLEDFKVGTIDFIIGSPPCQGFSDARGNRDPKSCFQESRNSLPILYIDWIEAIQPEIALMENVSGMATMKMGSRLFLEEIIDKIHEIKYNIKIGLLNSSHYGVPQERIRVFCLIYRDRFKRILDFLPFPVPEHIPQNFKKRKPRTRKVDIWYFEETEKNFFPKKEESKEINTLKNIFSDLPNEPTDSGIVKYSSNKDLNELQRYLRSDTKESVTLHSILREPSQEEKEILKNIPEGKIYRSSRFGDRYIGIWDLFKSKLELNEIFLLIFMCRFRTREGYKTKIGRHTEGYLLGSFFETYKQMLEMLSENEYFDKGDILRYEKMLLNESYPSPSETLESLENEKWLRSMDTKKGKAYDINTKSGIRPLYLRLHRNFPSRTIMTTSFRVRELVHPTIDRPITFREGARIQSFPDDFEFIGTPKEIANMIGNAVPPLLALELGQYYKYIVQNIDNGKLDTLLESFASKKTKLITEFF